jgi:hypothetical protein
MGNVISGRQHRTIPKKMASRRNREATICAPFRQTRVIVMLFGRIYAAFVRNIGGGLFEEQPACGGRPVNEYPAVSERLRSSGRAWSLFAPVRDSRGDRRDTQSPAPGQCLFEPLNARFAYKDAGARPPPARSD